MGTVLIQEIMGPIRAVAPVVVLVVPAMGPIRVVALVVILVVPAMEPIRVAVVPVAVWVVMVLIGAVLRAISTKFQTLLFLMLKKNVNVKFHIF